jgi:perosamine synthetase
MTWRWQPPVLSPVSSRGLVEGFGAAMRLRDADPSGVVKTLCARYSADEALLTNSGTAALILALRRILPPGGTVAFPGYGCVDLTSAAVGANARVRLYDLNPGTLSPDLSSVRRVCGQGVDAIVVAHLYGYPADVPGVQKIASEFGIPVIEDAAQGAGGMLDERLVGSFGDIGILSFGRGKGMTSGAGGAVLVRTPALATWVRQVRSEFGAAPAGGLAVMTLAAQSLLGHPSVYRLPASIPTLKLGEMVYHPPTAPRSMSIAAAAILQRALELDPPEVAGRRARAERLLSVVSGSTSIRPATAIAGGEPGFLRLALLDSSGGKLPCPSIGALRGYPITLEQHLPLREALLAGERAGRGSEYLRDHLFTLPTHSRVKSADLANVQQWLA